MEFFNHSKAGPICPVPTIWLPDHLKAGPKKCPRDGHLKAGQSGFRRGTVYCISKNQFWKTHFCSFITSSPEIL